MRILLPNHFPLEGSGSGIYTQNVARELTEIGHEALVITPAHAEQLGYPFEVRSILFSPPTGGPVSDDRLPFNFPCFTTHPLSNVRFGDLDERQRDLYVHAFMKEIQRAVKDWSPDLIHAQHVWVTPFAASKTGGPYLVTAHGTDLMGYREYPEWREIAMEGVRHARVIIAVSRQVAEETRAIFNLNEGLVEVVMNGFDQTIFNVTPVERSRLLERYGIASGLEVLLTFVGKLTRFKGVDVLLEAAASYESDLGRVVTLIIGEGELRDILSKRAQDLGLEGVFFLGHLPQDEVALFLNAADLSVVPSRVEPFGLVAVEALACGTPVVATNEGGLPDFVDERVGALVDVGDALDLAKTIVQEIRSNAKAEKGPFAAEYALEHFSWSGQVAKMVEVYRRVVAAGR